MEFNENPSHEDLKKIFSPTAVDQQIRMAIQTCWMGLSSDKRSPEEVATQIQRLVDRALEDFKEDSDFFFN